MALAAHALEVGADAVAVIAPPYFPLDAEELTRHFVQVANACDPLPFYLYEFAARSGYAIPIDVIARVRERSPNLRGLKVSDTPFSAVEPYLAVEGMDVFVGNEPLVLEGMERGAVGAVSGLATRVPGDHGGAGARPERTTRTTRSCGSGPVCRASRSTRR